MCKLDIPAFSYFEQGNAFTGSWQNVCRFRLVRQEETLCAAVWKEDICFELAEDKTEQSFSLTAEGLQEAVDWVTAFCKA